MAFVSTSFQELTRHLERVLPVLKEALEPMLNEVEEGDQ
jgi:hypothetical protein